MPRRDDEMPMAGNYYHTPPRKRPSKWRQRGEDFKEYAPYLALSMIFFMGAILWGTALGEGIERAINTFMAQETFTAKWVYVYDVFDPRRWF